MTTEQRKNVRGALISAGLYRTYDRYDEIIERVVHAVTGVTGERRKGCYTELFKHVDGTIVSVTWTEKTKE